MLLTILVWMLVSSIAFGLRDPFTPRRLVTAAIGGLAVGLVLSYFNSYVGSIRGLATLIGFALIISGAQFMRQYSSGSRPLHRAMPAAGIAIIVILVAGGLFPYTSWGAKSVSEPLYQNLNAAPVTDSAPSLRDAADVRVVPWELASQLLLRGYGQDASWLNTDPFFLQSTTYPDTVRGDFVWVHAPAPETAKWLFGGAVADRVVYVKNDATNTNPEVIRGDILVNVEGVFWQDRVQRYAQEHGELQYILQDVALQMDDEYTPYWIAYLSRLDFRSQPHLERLLLVNARTGEETDFAPEDAPAWIEQVYPESYVYEWTKYWGLHREGIFYRWFNAARLVEPDDVTVRYIRLEDQTYWLLPMRQLSSANLGGYVLVNTRTGTGTFYDRFDKQLVDYDTAHTQLQAIMASGEATRGQGQIRLTISEGYLYPIQMVDGTVRDAYVFPLQAGFEISRFAIIDAQDYNNRRVFASSMADALGQFSQLTNEEVVPTPDTPPQTTTLRVVEGTTDSLRTLVNLNGTWHRVTTTQLADGNRNEAEREMDELQIAIGRAQRGEDVSLEVLFSKGKIVDVRLPGISWNPSASPT